MKSKFYVNIEANSTESFLNIVTKNIRFNALEK